MEGLAEREPGHQGLPGEQLVACHDKAIRCAWRVEQGFDRIEVPAQDHPSVSGRREE